MVWLYMFCIDYGFLSNDMWKIRWNFKTVNAQHWHAVPPNQINITPLSYIDFSEYQTSGWEFYMIPEFSILRAPKNSLIFGAASPQNKVSGNPSHTVSSTMQCVLDHQSTHRETIFLDCDNAIITNFDDECCTHADTCTKFSSHALRNHVNNNVIYLFQNDRVVLQ